jgi:hypothetical protein
MSRQLVLRVSPQQQAAYMAASIDATVKDWIEDTLLAALGKRPRRAILGLFEIEIEDERDIKLGFWLSDALEPLVDEAAFLSRVSPTTWCTLVLDAAAGISQLSTYLKRVS